MKEFLEIIATLRSENGCPWDREQTHESLRSCIIEEAYELVSSIGIYQKTGNFENMREELGDVLLQVVMQSQIANEEGLFSFDDVVHEVATKMIRRHPHVFGTVEVEDSVQVLKNWEEIKKEEKKDKTWIISPLQEVPKELPALIRSSKVHKKLRQVYHEPQSSQEASQQIEVLAGQISQTISEGKKEELSTLLGNLLMEVTKIASIEKINVEQVLADQIDLLIEQVEQ